MHSLRQRITYANVVSTLALFLALAAGSFAAAQSIPDKAGRIHACFKKKGGAVRVVKGNKCRAGERRLVWNGRGRQGPTGPRGLPGVQGIAGKDGAKGADAATSVRVRQALGSQGASSTVTATCQGEERAIGGGTDYRESGGARAVVKTSAPVWGSDDVPYAWKSQVLNIQSPPTDNVEAFAYVICASP